MKKQNPRCNRKSPDAVITDIRELPECIKTFDNSDLCIYKNIIGKINEHINIMRQNRITISR